MDTKIYEDNLDRALEKLLKDMSGSSATWVEYREAILDAIEQSGILETLGDGTEEEHNAKIQSYIENSIKRLSAKAKIKNDQSGMAQNQPWPSSSAEKAAATVRCAPPVPPRPVSTAEQTDGTDGAIGCVVIVIIGVIIYVLCR